MSSVHAIVHALTEGDDDFDFEGDQKELQPSEWSLRFGRDNENNLWFAQLLWGGSPYGVVAQHVDKNICAREAAKMLQRFQQEERAYLQIGKRVRNTQTGEMGTITGIPGPDERWVHWDNDGGDPDSAARHSAYELELMEGLDDEDDLKDAVMPFGFEAKIKHIPTDNTWSILFYYDGKFQGSSSGNETEEIAKSKAISWVKEFNRCQTMRPFIPAKNVDVWSWYYGFGSRPKHLPPLEEGLEDEEDFKLEIHNAYAKGQRVRVTKGTYAGEPGTIEGAFHWGNNEIGWWVHLDNSDDPDSAITYRVDSIEPLTEAMEDDDLSAPPFRYKIFAASKNQVLFGVYALSGEDERWLGSIMASLTKGQFADWRISFIDRLHKHVNIQVPSQEEAAFRLWLDATGDNPITEAMEDDEPIEPEFKIAPITPDSAVYDIFHGDRWLGRVHHKTWGTGRDAESYYEPMWAPKRVEHEQPKHFKTAHEAALWFWHHSHLADEMTEAIVREATEDDDDSDWMKSLVHDPILISKSSLEAAGFQVEVCDRMGDSIVLVIHWAIPTVQAKLNGWKRATEILSPIIGKIKQGDYRFDHYYRGLQGEEKMVKVTIRKRLEDDPMLWRVEEKSPSKIGPESFWNVFFNGQQLGEIYTTSEGAERLRRELVELHRLVPFYPVGWNDDPGDMWGNGKIIAWWRAHRAKLPAELKVGEHFLDKSLLRQK